MKTCPKCNKQFSDDANFCPVDAARLTTAMAKLVDADPLTSRYTLGDKLGGSRTGAVHRAVDKQSGAAVVIKLVAPAVLAQPGVAQRLERELKQLERVQSAGVAKVLGSGKLGDQPWVAVEELPGAHTLADAITARGPIPVDQAARLVEIIGEALIEAAQVGVVHRDLAPKNVLFAAGDIKLVNFSLPVPVPEFVAPEQADGKPVDQRSNIYSLGALYHYVIAGQPYTGGAVKLDAPAPVVAVITRALDRSPTKRFLTVRQFVDEIGRVASAGDTIDPKATAAMGKVGKPKAMIVETLLGLREGMPAIARKPTPAPMAAPAPVAPAPAPAAVAIASAPTVGAGVPVLASTPPAVSTGTAIGMASGAERSPWAPPAAAPPVAAPPAAVIPAVPVAPPAPIIPAAPVMPKPVAQIVANEAPALKAPVVAAQAAPAAGKKKAADEPRAKKEKGKFRETMWFKKGELDSQAAVSADEELARTGKVGNDKADSLPMDERYKDDGSLSRGDKEKYSLRTGNTEMMPALVDPGPAKTGVTEDALVAEMKGGRTWVLAAIGAAVVGIILIIYMMVR